MAGDGLRVAIRLSSRVRTDRMVAVAASAACGHLLKATVTEPAEAGRANEALLQLLAHAWHVPSRDLSIVAGSTRRRKIVRVAGDPSAWSSRSLLRSPVCPAGKGVAR